MEIDADPRWHQYLLGIHELSGRVRQEWLNDAIAHGDANRVVAFFRGFLNEHAVDGGRAPRRSRQGAPDINDRTRLLTRSQIQELYSLHRRGKLVGPEWERTERDILAAAAAGRVIGAVDPHGK